MKRLLLSITLIAALFVFVVPVAPVTYSGEAVLAASADSAVVSREGCSKTGAGSFSCLIDIQDPPEEEDEIEGQIRTHLNAMNACGPGGAIPDEEGWLTTTSYEVEGNSLRVLGYFGCFWSAPTTVK